MRCGSDDRGLWHCTGTSTKTHNVVLQTETICCCRLIAATNLLTGVDSALRRPGRIDLEIFVPPPDRLDRLYILERIMQNFSFAAGVDLEGIASSCQGYTSADLHSLGSEVALKALYDVASNAVRSPFTLSSTNAHNQTYFTYMESSGWLWWI